MGGVEEVGEMKRGKEVEVAGIEMGVEVVVIRGGVEVVVLRG